MGQGRWVGCVGWVGDVAFAVWRRADGIFYDGSSLQSVRARGGWYIPITNKVVVSKAVDVTSGSRPIVVVNVRILNGTHE